jgi:hypothetical protein
MKELRKKLEPYYQEAEFWLLNAPQKEKELVQKHEDILQSSPGPGFEVAVQRYNYGDPTGEKARKLAELEHEEQWLQLVREIEQTSFGPIIRLRRLYGRGYRGNPVWRRIAKKVHYSERRVRQKWREAVYYTAFLAVSRGITRKKEAVYCKENVL